MLKTFKCLKAALLIAVALAATTGSAHAIGTLIPLSSGTFNSPDNWYDWAQGVGVDASGNILMTGFMHTGVDDADYLTVKFSPDFVMVSSATYDSPGRDDQAYAVAADASGNIIVTGISASGGSNIRWLTIKYDPGLTMVSSATLTSPWGGTAWADDVAVDSSGNIIVTGWCQNGTYTDAYTVKYSSDLQPLSSVSYNGPANRTDRGVGVSVDASDNIVVLSYINNGAGGGYFTAKYTPDLQVISSATYHVAGSVDDMPYDVDIDQSGNIIVTGYTLCAAGLSTLVIKYDPDMKLLSSTQYPKLYPHGVAADQSGNIIVTGQYDNGTNNDFATLKFDPNLQLISTGTYNGPANSHDYAYAAVVDSSGNIVIGGASSNGANLDYCVIKYNGLPPVVSGCVPASATQGDTFDLVVTGSNFLPGATALLSGPGITVNSLTLDSTSQMTANITLSINPSAGSRNVSVTNVDALSGALAAGFLVLKKPAPVLASVLPVLGPLAGGTTVTLTGINFLSGATVTIGGSAASDVTFVSSTTLTALTPPGISWGEKDILVTNPDAQSSTIAGGFFYEPVRSTSTIIDPIAGGMAVIEPENGYIGVTIPAGTFGESVALSVSTAAVPASHQATIIVTNVGIEVSAGGHQPGKDITITVYYRDADIAGLEESKLSLARYESGRWIPIPTVVHADQNWLVGTIKHLSTFAVVQLVPAPDLAGVRVYPNPFTPRNGSLIIANLTGEAEIKIYNVAGELVRTLNYTTANGQAAWDGKNDSGSAVASGVYLALIKSSAGKKTVKIAVER